MRGMKDSGIEWLGEIPSEWTTGIINWIADEVNVAAFDKDGLSYIGMENVESSTSRVIGELDDAVNYSSSIKFFDEETILLGKLRPYLAKTAFPKFMGICSSEFITLKAKQMNPRYLVRLLACYKLSDCFNSDTTGVKMPRTNWLQIKKIGCPIPPTEEQELIADYLNKQCKKIDLAIDAAEKSIEEYKAYKQSVIFETVTKGLNPNAPMKASGIEWLGAIPGHWQTITISQLADQTKTPNDGMKETNLLSLSYGKIKRRDIDAAEGLLPASFEGYNIVEPNDIVLRFTDLQNDQKSLRVGRVTEKGIITSAYTTIRPSNAEDSEYLYYCLHSYDLRKGFYGMGAGVRQGLKWQEAKYIEIPWPSLEERNKITSTLNEQCGKIDSAIEAKERIIEELKTYKKSLIYEVVTGKREIDGC